MRARRLAVPAVLAVAGLCALPGSAAAAPKTVWLCKPGLKDNPCSVSLKTTRFSTTLKALGVENLKPARHPKFDCFYVYPTVSDQKTPVANFNIDPELRSIALYQAARYTSECRVYAPVYRQATVAALPGGLKTTAQQREQAYRDVRNAWRRYLTEFNRGRGVVLIGHSQGTFVLRRLVKEEIDSKPAARRRLISALLLGGNVLVKKGKDVGGDFKHVRACRSRHQVGCVVAYSTFGETPPPKAFFGRTTKPGLEVLCTNPVALGGGSGKLTPVYPSAPFAPGTIIGAATGLVGIPRPSVSTAWLSFPNSYRANCTSTAGVNVLQIYGLRGAPQPKSVPNATWGAHLTDANIALENLTDLVRVQAAAWRKRH